MAKRTKPQHADRVVNTTTGETGTLIDVHDGSTSKKKKSTTNTKVHYSVLLDHGPRVCVTWEANEAEWSLPIRGCKRCGAKNHTPMACPAGDL